MSAKNSFAKYFFCLIVLVGIDYLPAYAQKQKTKVTIIKETYDEQGNKTVETIIKEGPEAEAIDLENLSAKPNDSNLQWKQFNLDSLPLDGEFFNYSLKSPLDIKSLLDSFGMGDLDFFDLPNFGDYGFSNESNHKPKLGVRVGELESQSGVVITQVMPDTPAERAGLKEGDIILSADEQKIESPEDLVGYIQSLQSDGSVTLNILREGNYLETVVKLTEFKPKKELEIRKI